jgi:glycine/D-amino acid oxidase-like deaminating enzyme
VLSTPKGRIRARQVIVATGYATPWFRPLLARFRLRHTYVMATAALPARDRARVGLTPVMIWDTDRPYHYGRWTEDGRLLLGGADRPRLSGSRRARALQQGVADVRAYFERRFPELASIATEYAWEGLFASTPDGLPYVGPHRRYPRHLFALGYGGNGMTLGFLASRLLLDRVEGRDTADQELFAFSRGA